MGHFPIKNRPERFNRIPRASQYTGKGKWRRISSKSIFAIFSLPRVASSLLQFGVDPRKVAAGYSKTALEAEIERVTRCGIL